MNQPVYRVLLINPSANRFAIPTASLGLARIAAALPPRVLVQGMDLNVFKWIFGLDPPSLLATVENYLLQAQAAGVLPDLIGFAVYEETVAEATTLARLARRLGINTVAGGIHPTLFPDQMPLEFDFLIRGAGETPFAQLVAELGPADHCACGDLHQHLRHSDHQHAPIAGLSLHPSGKDWLHLGDPALPPTPVPLPRSDIFNDFNLAFRYYSARVQSSQGCPFACAFCANAQFARVWQPRPVAAVLDEIDQVLRDPAISEITFADDQFLGFSPPDYQRAYQILHALERISRGRNLRINLQVRADQFSKALSACPELAPVIRAINRNFRDPSALISMQLHGRPVQGFSLDIGVESFLDERLTRFAKGLTVAANRRAIRLARELGVDLGLYMILFTPEITLEQIEQEFEAYLREFIDTDVFAKAAFLNLFQELVPYQGTPIYQELQKSGQLVPNGPVHGFRFADPRVAAFYLLYLYHTQTGRLDALQSRDELVGLIRQLLRQSRAWGNAARLQPMFNALVCELTDAETVRGLYRQARAVVSEDS